MKIGFFGNTNNYPFMLALAVRQLGHEVVFFVNRKERLHRPAEKYSWLSDNYDDWIIDVSDSFLKYWKYLLPLRVIDERLSELESCDALILNGLGPALIGCRTSLPVYTLLTGFDLDIHADFTCARNWIDGSSDSVIKKFFRKVILYFVTKRQRKGIHNSVALNYFPEGVIPEADIAISKIMSSKKYFRSSFMMSDVSNLHAVPADMYSEAKPLTIFYGCRINWKKPVRPGLTLLDYKGTDIFIRGLFEFLSQYKGDVEVQMVEKGVDVCEAKELIQELGIGSCITWCKELSQLEFYNYVRKSDVIVDQLSESLVGMVGLDAMALGKPVIANGRPEIFEPLTNVSAPICQAKNSKQVAEQLRKLVDFETRKRIGEESRHYVDKYFSPKSAAMTCIDNLNQTRTKQT